MRLHALAFALFVLGAQAASIPDKKDIEKKLAAVVKEVLNKDEVPLENIPEQEIIEPIAVKDVENNLKKSPQPSDIPVKVVVEAVQPAVRIDEKKEDNEVSPASEESDEIVREEIDLKNPGPPQRMQHDTQNPEHFEDAQQAIVIKNNAWRQNSQYAAVQKEIKELKDTFENKMTELFESLKEHMKTHSDQDNADRTEKEEMKVRSSVRDDASSTAGGSGSSGASNSTSQWGSGPFGGFFQNWASSFQQNLQNLNQTVNNYWSNSTNSNSTSGNSCDGSSSNSPTNIFSWGGTNPLNFGQQQGTGQQSQQSDEPARPGLWQTVQQNVQSFFQGNPQAPAGTQSDTQPAQPNRPIVQAFQNVIQQAGNMFQRPTETPPQQPSQATTQEGANVVPVESKPDGEKQKVKPEQATPQPQQSGPIVQMIGSNPVAQGLVGAVQRIQHAIVPTKPKEVKNVSDEPVKDTKGGFFPPPPPPHRPISGDNNDVSSSGVEAKPEETPDKEVQEKPTREPEKAPEVKEKSE